MNMTLKFTADGDRSSLDRKFIQNTLSSWAHQHNILLPPLPPSLASSVDLDICFDLRDPLLAIELLVEALYERNINLDVTIGNPSS